MSTIRFIMLGGFLGAGKTTTIGRLARHYQERGQRVGIVTNDQASDLVDTHTLRSQGFQVGEVAGACFCCSFNDLTETIGQLEEAEHPDIVIAEPVGSCTDLVATVVQPLRGLHSDQFTVAPYGVILKPSHGKKILGNEARAGFSPKAAYIFRKQLEEADFVIVNRVDELPSAEVDELVQLVAEHYPGRPTLRLSAKTGVGFETLVEILEQQGSFGQRILEIDYDIYADGEAELGWLNSSIGVRSEHGFALDTLLVGIVEQLRASLQQASAETAHLKTIGMCSSGHGVANLISSDSPAELSLPSDATTAVADLIVNARVAIAPEPLEQLVRQAVEQTCQPLGITPEFRQTQSFRPGRPVPTHRYATPVPDASS